MAESKITQIGREKLCKAHAGAAPLPKIVKMAFGDGGIGADGTVIPATGKETELKASLLEKTIDAITFPIVSDGSTPTGFSTTASYAVKLGKSELVGKMISEQGLIDEDGDLVAYKTFLAKGKDGDVDFLFDMQEIF